MAAATAPPAFCIPGVVQPSCSSYGKGWRSRDLLRRNSPPEWCTHRGGGGGGEPTDSGASTSSSVTPPTTEEDYSEEEGESSERRMDELEEEEAVRGWKERVAEMTDQELDWVEEAHRLSRFLEIYSEPSLRFYQQMPPVSFAFVTPRVSLVGSSGGSRRGDRLEETRESPASTPGAADTTLVASETTPADESSKSDSVLLPGSPACEETTTTTTPSSTLNNAPPTPPPSEPVDSCGNFEVSRMDVLSEQIWDFHNQITQKNETLTKKLSLRDMLYYAISPVFPMCGLYVVGSSLNGFGNDRSDMDLCLMITNKDLDQKTDAVVVLNMILTTLQKMDWVTYQKLILAKVPILRIRFAAPYDDITVDLNANNSVAIKNTHLLCYYSSFDWRVRPLVSIVKEWAKRKGINDANRSSFTSYSLVLMVIHYLQCGMQPALLPSLQTKFPKRFHPRVDVRMLSVTQPLAADLDWTFHEKATLGELLIGFLKYFSSKFDYDSHAISVREGKLITRKAVTRSRSNNFNNSNNNVTWRSQWRCICIEEPFTFSNTAHSIYDEMVFDAIKKSFKEAHDELERTRDINRLLECSPITVVPPIHGATAYVYDGVSREATLESGNGHGAAVVAATAATATAAATTPAATSVAAAVAAGAPSPSSR